MAERNSKQAPPKTELTARSFTPLEEARTRRSFPLSPGYLALGLLGVIAAAIFAYLFAARAVIFRLDPDSASLDVSGISFNIGSNYLLLPGEHRVSGEAAGYYPLDRSITVTGEKTQEIALALEPLPGKLVVDSELDGVEVSIDGQPAGAAPGTIEGISRGAHRFTFSKHRYFPLEQEIDIEGLGRTQSVTVSLEPAWGQMNFSSAPRGADLYIDGQLIGQTPLTTEVLETGSRLKLAAPGYKTWEQEVSVRAGTTGTHPPIRLVVADGLLDVGSTPGGASVTIDEEFRGTTPLSVALSPLRGHRVELFLEGYRKAVRDVTIESEQRATLAVGLTPIIGRIMLRVSPPDAEVVVDGRAHGQGSQALELTARAHEVTVRKAGYEARSMTVTPRPEREQSLEVSLLTLEQAYWASRPPRITSPVGSELLLFRPDSTFMLGAPRREPGRRANEAERSVRLHRPFYLGTHEVSNGEFRLWKEEHTSRAIKGHTLDMDRQPVANVTWQDAALFCNWLSRREGLPPFYVVENGLVTRFEPDSHGYRLPTEAEWAWAARFDATGTARMFPWGTTLYPPTATTANYADLSAATFLAFTLSNYDDGYPVSAPVGSFEPNGKGLYDMDGNVAEWTNDYYDIRPSRGEPQLDPTGPETGNRHVIRGASWALGSRSELRLSYREPGNERRMDAGFRLARYVDKAGAAQ
jgi:formylglycine-generating enzyme required for sulfatase activity